jgi:hypothetical protein
MINKLLGISRVDDLQKKSDGIFSVFTDTLKKLESVNTSINAEMIRKQDLIDKTNSELSTLEGMRSKNKNIADKIEAFFN